MNIMKKLMKVATVCSLMLTGVVFMPTDVNAKTIENEIEQQAMVLERNINEKAYYTLEMPGHISGSLGVTFKGSYTFHKGTVNTVTDLILSITPDYQSTNGVYTNIDITHWDYEITSTGIRVHFMVTAQAGKDVDQFFFSKNL